MGIQLLTEEEYRQLQEAGPLRYQDVELGESTCQADTASNSAAGRKA